jgi:PAS domain S-box-containing protein
MSKAVTAVDNWQSTLDALEDSVWLLDADQRIVRCNRAACELFGKSADDMLGRRCCEIVHDTTDPIPECPMCRMQLSHQRESMDLAVGDKWYHVTVDPQPSNGDGPASAVHVIRDITERKQLESKLRSLNRAVGQRVDEQTQDLQHTLEALEEAQNALQASEREKRAILDAPREHMLLLDRDMTIRWPNLAACESVDMTREALIGRKCYTVWEDRKEPCPDCPVVRAMEHGEDYETEKETPDGRSWFIRGYPIRDGQGEVVGAVEVTRDITEHKRIELKLLQSEERFRLMFEMHDAVMMLIDPASGRIVDANRAAVQFYGHPHARLCHMYISDINTLTPEKLAVEMQRAKDMKNNCFIFEHKLCNQEIRTVEVHSTPITFRNRDVLFSIIHDITERKQGESLLAEQQKRLRQLAAKLANAQDEEQRRIAEGLHDDVGQLLAASKINLAVARGSSNPQKAEDARQTAEDLIKEASEKIGDLCFELGSSTLYRLGLHSAILDFCARMETRYGLRVDVNDATNGAIFSDTTSAVLFKGVRELLFNVVKHAGVKDVEISICRHDTELSLIVEDHGGGFPHDAETGAVDTGTGFGLFGIGERLRDIGGKLTIKSEPNVFTRVSLRVPLRDGH